jgi:hypothetical protein
MATDKANPREAADVERKPALLLAEYDGPDAVIAAAEKVRDAGYTKWDVHTPYPVHGMDAAMGLRDTPLGWIVFVMGLTGCLTGFFMILWMNGIDYPLVIGGKPPDAVPSMIPVMFELTILLSAFGTVFGLFGLCQLPRHHHPVFESDRFRRATDDRFYVSVEAADPKFDLKKTRSLLEGTRPTHVELVEEEVLA